MITQQETFDFIKKLENTFNGKDPIDITDEESVDLYYINKLFQYNSLFRLYILVAFCLYMDTATEQDQKPVTIDEQINRCISLMRWMQSKVSSQEVLQRILLHSISASEKLVPNKKV